MLTPANTALWITSFRRLDPLRDTIRGWLDSFDFDAVNVIANDPTVQYGKVADATGCLLIEMADASAYGFRHELDDPGEYPPPQLRIWRNTYRDPWETGAIAWCWNQAMRHTFEHRDWCLMSQDDVIITPGWDSLVTTAHDTYIAPHGDTVQLQSLAGFRQVGWFDERFRAIGGPEADYLLRCLQTYPDRLSAHDEHVWQLRHRDVGLANHWRGAPKAGEVLDTRNAYNVPFADAECFARWEQKWGIPVDHLFTTGQVATARRRAGWDEIDWYPSFTRRLADLGRW